MTFDTITIRVPRDEALSVAAADERFRDATITVVVLDGAGAYGPMTGKLTGFSVTADEYVLKFAPVP